MNAINPSVINHDTFGAAATKAPAGSAGQPKTNGLQPLPKDTVEISTAAKVMQEAKQPEQQALEKLHTEQQPSPEQKSTGGGIKAKPSSSFDQDLYA